MPTKSLTDFIRDHKITMTTRWADHNPHMVDARGDMTHWKCRIRTGRRSMIVVFSQGAAYAGKEPTLLAVLGCLASDASGYENADSFEDWAREYGFDEDSRKAGQAYKAVERQAEGLQRILGPDAYHTLLWDVDRE